MTNPAQSLVVERMHQKERREDVAQLVLLVKTTREEAENPREEKQEHSVERKMRVFMAGSKGGVR